MQAGVVSAPTPVSSALLDARCRELQSLLDQAAHAYYVMDQPILEDADYDRLYRELARLEQASPERVSASSPTQKVGADPAKGVKKIQHRLPMLSLDSVYCFEELDRWHQSIARMLDQDPNGLEFAIEPKVDGVAVGLTYRNGQLVQASTRGNGHEGEDITANVQAMKTVPQRLNMANPPEWVEVRGEAFMPMAALELVNAKRKASNESEFTHLRHACAGTMRQSSPSVVAERGIEFYAYSFHLPDDYQPAAGDAARPATQIETLQWLEAAGFMVNRTVELSSGIDTAKAFIANWQQHRNELPYASDGVVLKLNLLSLQQAAGSSRKAPRWAVAFK